MTKGMYQADCIAVAEQIDRAFFGQALLSCFVFGIPRLLSHEIYDGKKYLQHIQRISRCATQSELSNVAEDWPLDFATIFHDLAMPCTTLD
jgi:hypothetical protein